MSSVSSNPVAAACRGLWYGTLLHMEHVVDLDAELVFVVGRHYLPALCFAGRIQIVPLCSPSNRILSMFSLSGNAYIACVFLDTASPLLANPFPSWLAFFGAFRPT